MLINTFAFYLLSDLSISILISNTIAFVASVSFAYWTNTRFVFKAKFTKKNFMQFWGMRIAVLVADNILMVVMVGFMDKLPAKVVVNTAVIIINYICSKIIIYNKEGGN